MAQNRPLPSLNPIDRAQALAIAYYNEPHVPANFTAEDAHRKADYYESMAETCAEMCGTQ